MGGKEERQKERKQATDSPIWGHPCCPHFSLFLESGEENIRQLSQGCPRVMDSPSRLVCVEEKLLKLGSSPSFTVNLLVTFHEPEGKKII